ncbi:MAG TPA: hypothetical protein IGS53_04040 [Leptolyngbyaceae cyanobacterium M33_DOE_097]|uniref:Uncharacterized protein n=1 Tax=Oscillatoriales cyanobacterium SpSt-418 TaxID=2282169 RepID=A0A7C3KFU1_9CYAN|nr:hypothetical protein [Leptolyngbyaceae cyanobacterium M33_DOE_097]
MRRQTLFALAGSIAIAIAGCGDSGTETASSPSPSPAASPAPAASPSPAAGQNPAQRQQPFAQPLTTQSSPPGLIKSTNADERVKQVQKNIRNNRQAGTTATATLGTASNPFAAVPLQVSAPAQIREVVPDLPVPPAAQTSPFTAFPPPPVSLRPPATRPTAPGSSPAPPRRTSTPRPPGTASRPTAPSRTPLPPPASRPPLASRPTPPTGVSPNTTAAAPTRPSTPQADGIVVTGVVQVNGKVYAIIQESAGFPSTYVRVGQRLANGAVVVKRINITPGGEPTVVLEQNGVEVTKVVGEGAAAGGVTT